MKPSNPKSDKALNSVARVANTRGTTHTRKRGLKDG